MQKKRGQILVTRPGPDGKKLCEELILQGHDCLSWPLIEIVLKKPDAQLIEKASGFVVTSKNALESLKLVIAESACLKPLAKNIYVVGQKTALKAEALGFSNIFTGKGTAKELAGLIKSQYSGKSLLAKKNSFLLHLAGDHLAYDLVGDLNTHGISARTEICYHSRQADHMPERIKRAFRQGEIHTVLLMSPRTASIFVDFMIDVDLLPFLCDSELLCISQAVKDKIIIKEAGIHPNIKIANRPTLESLLELLDN